MKKILLISFIFLYGCTTKYVKSELISPPDFYTPSDVKNQRELIREYKNCLMKITEWQRWYIIQTNSYKN